MIARVPGGRINPDHIPTFAHAEEDLEYFGAVRRISQGKDDARSAFLWIWIQSGAEPHLPLAWISGDRVHLPGRNPQINGIRQTGKTLYYNGIPTIKKKTVLAKEKASGIMIWQLSGDATGFKVIA